MNAVPSLLALLLAVAPASRPFVAQGDYWQIRLNLPDGWKPCLAKAPTPNHGFALIGREQPCETAAAPLRFLVEPNLEDGLPDTASLQRQSGCGSATRILQAGDRTWHLCTQAHGGETALHVQACGESPNDAVIVMLQSEGGSAAVKALFGRVLESVQLRCPGTAP
ncbi:MAG: hypothetical protein JNN30_22560 [Rhodanobacteraceae bacterium]|nr:hypothetical protein [Rhodanobacteraceae bacterium]